MMGGAWRSGDAVAPHFIYSRHALESKYPCNAKPLIINVGGVQAPRSMRRPSSMLGHRRGGVNADRVFQLKPSGLSSGIRNAAG